LYIIILPGDLRSLSIYLDKKDTNDYSRKKYFLFHNGHLLGLTNSNYKRFKKFSIITGILEENLNILSKDPYSDRSMD